MFKETKSKLAKSPYIAKGSIDVTFLLIVLALLITGLVMLFSAGYSYAYHKYDNSTYFILRQGVFAVLGVTAMLIISKVNYNFFRYAAVIGMAVAFLLLVLVLLLPEWKPGFKR